MMYAENNTPNKVSEDQLISVSDNNRLNDFLNLLRLEADRWWGTNNWLVQLIAWVVIINSMFLLVLMQGVESLVTSPAYASALEPFAKYSSDLYVQAKLSIGLAAFTEIAVMVVPVGVIITMQNSLVGERDSGTLAWLISQPINRSTVVVAKILANSTHLILFVTIFPSIAFYGLVYSQTGILLPFGPLVGHVCLLALEIVFYVSLVTMLGTLFKSRGPILIISLGLAFVGDLVKSVPELFDLVSDFTPRFFGMNGFNLFVEGELLRITPLVVVPVLSVIFVVVSLIVFTRDEF